MLHNNIWAFLCSYSLHKTTRDKINSNQRAYREYLRDSCEIRNVIDDLYDISWCTRPLGALHKTNTNFVDDLMKLFSRIFVITLSYYVVLGHVYFKIRFHTCILNFPVSLTSSNKYISHKTYIEISNGAKTNCLRVRGIFRESRAYNCAKLIQTKYRRLSLPNIHIK